MRAVDPGYATGNALVIRPGQLHTNDYPTREAAAAFHEQVLARVRAMPGVVGAVATTCPPLSSYCHGDPVSLPGRPWDEGDMPPIASFRRVGPGYFETLGIRLVRGRTFDGRDHQVATRAIVVDVRMAELYFPGEEPIGKQVVYGEDGADPYEVVGVVDHVMTWGVMSADRPPQVYLPLVSHTAEWTPSVHVMAYIVRTAGPPMDLLPAIRRTIAEIDANVPVALATTLEAMLAEDRAPMAFTMTLIAIAATVALLLGLVGIYGVISYVVAQRASEIGVRLALGARPTDVAAMVLRQGGLVAGSGLVLGLLAAAAGSRLLASILYDVSATDLPTYTLVAGALLTVSLAACWIPARRAARLDPAEALRN
jgi:predicted permease